VRFTGLAVVSRPLSHGFVGPPEKSREVSHSQAALALGRLQSLGEISHLGTFTSGMLSGQFAPRSCFFVQLAHDLLPALRITILVFIEWVERLV
jgi:hypothetical protein